jgi:hypothetical protein
MKVKNFYIHSGKDYITLDDAKLYTSKQLTDDIELLRHFERRGYTYTNDVFRIINTNIVFAVDDFAGITADDEEISIHMAHYEDIENVGRTLRINRQTHQMYLTDMYIQPIIDWSYYKEYFDKDEYEKVLDALL